MGQSKSNKLLPPWGNGFKSFIPIESLVVKFYVSQKTRSTQLQIDSSSKFHIYISTTCPAFRGINPLAN